MNRLISLCSAAAASFQWGSNSCLSGLHGDAAESGWALWRRGRDPLALSSERQRKLVPTGHAGDVSTAALWSNKEWHLMYMGFPGGSVVGNPPAMQGEMGLIPVSGRSPGEGNGNPLQYSCLDNPMDRGNWQATIHGVTKCQTWLSACAHTHTHTHTHLMYLEEWISVQQTNRKNSSKCFQCWGCLGGVREKGIMAK